MNNKNTDYKIITKPSLTYVINGKKMSFFLQKVNPSAPDVKNLNVSWYCINNSQEDQSKQTVYKGPSGPEWINAKWNSNGVHTIVCCVKRGLLDKGERYEYTQRVISAEECVSYSHDSFDESDNPFNVLHNLTKQIELIHDLESKSQLSENENTKYKERIANMETYRDKLQDLLDKIPESHQDHFNFVAARHYSSEYQDTNSILLQVGYFYADNKVYLLDWTNPVVQGWCGVFEGEGNTEQEALCQAFDEWENNNRYPDGLLKCYYLYYTHPTIEIPKYVEQDGNQVLAFDINDYHYWEKHQFSTDGSTCLDSLSNALSWFAIGTAVVAGAILFFVPGGQVGTAALWAMAASSVAAIGAATINITQRFNTGFSNWKEDGLDSLTIAASLLGLSSIRALTKWGPLASLSHSAGNVARANTIKFMLIGQVAADSTQAIFISVELSSAIYSTIDDSTLAADEKLSRILRLLAAGVTVGALTYVNVKATSGQFNFLNKDVSKVSVLSKAQIDEILANPHLLIEHGEVLTTPVVQESRQPVALMQLTELKLLPNYNPEMNVLFPPQSYLRQLRTSTNTLGVAWIDKQISQHFISDPYEATLLRLSEKNTQNAATPDQTMVRTNNQQVSKTIVNTKAKRETIDQNIAKLQQIARNSKIENADWKKNVAISRATCTIEGIDFDRAKDFFNLQFSLAEAEKAGVVIKGEFTGSSAPIKIVDIDRYIQILKDKYPSEEMDDLTETLIKDYLTRHDGNLQNFDGMPGAHAEILAVNDVFIQLRAMDLEPSDYYQEIEVYTLKTNRPSKEDDFLKAFPACKNCSGILEPQIQVHTGRTGDKK